MEHPDESEEIREDGEEGVITPPERKISEQYRMDWQYPVLWTNNYSQDVFDRFIFLSNKWGADSGAEPIDMLIRKLGADEAFVSGSMIWDADDRMLSVTVSAFAPDRDIATALAQDLDDVSFGQDDRFIRVNINHDDFAISNGRRLIDVLAKLQRAGCKPITVNFEELRGFSVSL